MRALIAVVMILFLSPAAQAQEEIPEVARTLLERGERLRESGQTDKAIAAFEEVVRIAPSVTAAWSNLGLLHYQNGRSTEALAVFLRGLDANPANELLLSNAIAVAQPLNRAGDLLPYADRAVEIRPRAATLHALRATTLRAMNRNEEALAGYERSVALDPGDARTQFSLGNVAYALGMKDRAIDAYRKAVRIDPTLLRAHYNLGAALFETGHDDDALESYRMALAPIDAAFKKGEKVEVIHAKAFQNLGAIHLRKRDMPNALTAYEKALRLDPALVAAHYSIGFIHFIAGDDTNAERSYRKALELDPSLPLAHLHLGVILFRESMMRDAIAQLEKGLEFYDTSSLRTARLTIARAHATLGEFDEATTVLDGLLTDVPTDPEALALRARLSRQLGHFEEAKRFLERVATSSTGDSSIELERAALAHGVGDVESERSIYIKLSRDLNDPERLWLVRANLALLNLREGRIAEAQPQIADLLTRPPTTRWGPSAARRLRGIQASLLAATGKLKESERELRSILADDPSSQNAILGMAILGAMQGKPDAAIASLGTLLDNASGQTATIASANLGVLLWSEGKSTEAAKRLNDMPPGLEHWIALQTALAEADMLRGRTSQSISRLNVAHESCSGAPVANRFAAGAVVVGEKTADHKRICSRAVEALAAALTSAAVAESGSSGEVRAQLDRAITLGSNPRNRAIARFLRGSEELGNGSYTRAAEDFRSALDDDLPAGLAAAAHNNAGVALVRLGRVVQAEGEFVLAHKQRLPAAALNLGILYDERLDRPDDAIRMYTAYIEIGGSRATEARSAVERLRRKRS